VFYFSLFYFFIPFNSLAYNLNKVKELIVSYERNSFFSPRVTVKLDIKIRMTNGKIKKWNKLLTHVEESSFSKGKLNIINNPLFINNHQVKITFNLEKKEQTHFTLLLKMNYKGGLNAY
jgi:hypothetical protein